MVSLLPCYHLNYLLSSFDFWPTSVETCLLDFIFILQIVKQCKTLTLNFLDWFIVTVGGLQSLKTNASVDVKEDTFVSITNEVSEDDVDLGKFQQTVFLLSLLCVHYTCSLLTSHSSIVPSIEIHPSIHLFFRWSALSSVVHPYYPSYILNPQFFVIHTFTKIFLQSCIIHYSLFFIHPLLSVMQ